MRQLFRGNKPAIDCGFVRHLKLTESHVSRWPAAVFDISRKTTVAVKERAGCIIFGRLDFCTHNPRLSSYKLYLLNNQKA